MRYHTQCDGCGIAVFFRGGLSRVWFSCCDRVQPEGIHCSARSARQPPGRPPDPARRGTQPAFARAGRGATAGAAPSRRRVRRGTPRRRPEPGADVGGRPPQRLPFRAAVPGGHRAAAAPVRDHAPRRAGQSTPASRNGPFPDRDRGARRILGSKPILPSLQAPRRRHAGSVPDARKIRTTRRKSLQETRLANPLPFPMSRVGRRGRADDQGRLNGPALLGRRHAANGDT